MTDGPSLELLVDWLRDAVEDGEPTKASVLAAELGAAAMRFAHTAVEPVLSETP